ncbi:MAG: ABC transporter permease [Cyclobacteriaceae bacterium]|nr:ABC transporter permease [Cyclobacteriaceae bacterium]
MSIPIQLRIAFRNLARNKVHTLINIAGLSISVTVCILIALFVREEYSFDKHFPEGERIYRVAGNYFSAGGDEDQSAATSYLLQPMIPDMPGVDAMCRIGFSPQLLGVDSKEFLEYGVLYADSSFFRVFQMPFLRGDRASALSNPGSIVLDDMTAQRFFGTNDVVGRLILIRGKSFIVSGVMETWPSNSHFFARIILPMSGVVEWLPDWVKDNMTGRNMYTYFKANSHFNQVKLEAAINSTTKPLWTGDTPPEYFIQSLRSIYLQSHLNQEIETNGNKTTVSIFSITALVILILACINYINLTMAGSFQRSKEIGMKKILGTSRFSLLGQFLTESFLVVSVSVTAAAILVMVAMPSFNQLNGKALLFNPFTDVSIGLGLVAITVIIAILAGIFPAALLLRSKVMNLLSGKLEFNNGRQYLRNGLIMFQFAISATLIASTLIVVDQVNFIRTKDLGINPERIVIVPLQTPEIASRFERLKAEFLRDANVVSVTGSNNKVTRPVSTTRPYIIDWKQEDVGIPSVTISYDFFETMGTQMVAGRSFSKEVPTDLKDAYIINESAAKLLGMKDPVGGHLFGFTFTGSKWFEKNGTVIGVVKDFHFASLHTQIVPTVFTLASETTESLDWMEIRISGDGMGSLTSLANIWAKVAPERSFQFEFMEDDLKLHYQAEDRFLKLFSIFSTLSILIGGLGLFGITAFMAARRTKEIGIRKILGSSVPAIIGLLSRNFLAMVVLSNILAWPLAWYFMNNWLLNFAYQTTISWRVFLLTGLAAIFIAFLAILHHAMRVARANPVKALRWE